MLEKRGRPSLWADKKEELLRLRELGLTHREIGKRFGVTRKTIERAFARIGLPFSFWEKRDPILRELAAIRTPSREIAIALNCGIPAVHRRRNKLGISQVPLLDHLGASQKQRY